MAEADDVKVHAAETAETVPSTKEERIRAARREFLGQSIAATSGIALLGVLGPSVLEAAPQAIPCPPPGPTLIPIGEITSNAKKLQAVMTVTNGTRNVPTSLTAAPTPTMLRYFEGVNPADPSQKWPVTPSAPGPGPTLRCALGDTVQITLLNQVKVQDFGGSLDSGEEGRGTGCDQATKVNADGTTDKNWYPSIDKYPDCLHGSSSANIHFHGTHVTPSTTGDNVLVQVRPNPQVTERGVRESFRKIFHACEMGREPQKWEDLPIEWRENQRVLLEEYDITAPFQGGHGLPLNLRLWPQNREAIAESVWPQWYIGSYPYCFQIPEYEEDKNHRPIGVKMGQAPGTHWYHSHKHGSTAINLFNGLAGALIITDDSPEGYDGKLKGHYASKGQKLQELVLVFQQITAAPNLLSAAPAGPPAKLVNGQFAPTINMRPGQIQLWRMINATVQAFVNVQFNPVTSDALRIKFRQTAQDGVQLARKNYGDSQNGKSAINMAPANRVDLLVQAPDTKGCYVLGTAGAPILYINVTGDALNPRMEFPKEEEFPKQPPFLADIEASTIRFRREVVYGWEAGRTAPGRNPANAQPPLVPNAPPHYLIDGKQFEDQIIDQVMLLDSAEEWTIVNDTTGIAHPFHIHVNPFQIVEVFDPNTMTTPLKLPQPYVWWDTFAIPKGKLVNGKIVPGYFKMRSRFVDFTGLYVQHCHILPHEDRGMMQLVQVVSNRTLNKHH